MEEAGAWYNDFLVRLMNNSLIKAWRDEGKQISDLRQKLSLLQISRDRILNQSHALSVLISAEQHRGTEMRNQLKQLCIQKDLTEMEDTIANIKTENIMLEVALEEKTNSCNHWRNVINRLYKSLKETIFGQNKLSNDLMNEQNRITQLESEQIELLKKMSETKGEVFKRLEELHHQIIIKGIAVNAAKNIKLMQPELLTSKIVSNHSQGPNIPIILSESSLTQLKYQQLELPLSNTEYTKLQYLTKEFIFKSKMNCSLTETIETENCGDCKNKKSNRRKRVTFKNPIAVEITPVSSS